MDFPGLLKVGVRWFLVFHTDLDTCEGDPKKCPYCYVCVKTKNG